MAKIIGIENYEYHMVDDNTGATRDFVGFKVFVAASMLPSQGRGLKVTEYPVSTTDAVAVFGVQLTELDSIMNKEIYIETVPKGKKQFLTRVIPVK